MIEYLSEHFSTIDLNVNFDKFMGNDPKNTYTEAAKRDMMINLRALCQNVLEPLYDYLGYMPHITTGWKHKMEKGLFMAPNHFAGCAVDIKLDDEIKMADVYQWMADELHFDELFWVKYYEERYIHVSYRNDANRQLMNTVSLHLD